MAHRASPDPWQHALRQFVGVARSLDNIYWFEYLILLRMWGALSLNFFLLLCIYDQRRGPASFFFFICTLEDQ